jgi:hypothetical protein
MCFNMLEAIILSHSSAVASVDMRGTMMVREDVDRGSRLFGDESPTRRHKNLLATARLHQPSRYRWRIRVPRRTDISISSGASWSGK